MVFLLAACGGTSTGGGGGSAPITTSGPAMSMPPMSMPPMSMPPMSMPPPAGGDASTPVATASVAITNFAFVPATITVRAGTTVTWTNSDGEPHTVTARDKGFASPTLRTAGSYKFTFSAPGRYDYLCTIHPFMTATVVVTP
jgi:plastocyanin